MPGTRLTALILAALSITALRAQDKTSTANQSSSGHSVSFGGPRPTLKMEITEPEIPPVIHICIAGCGALMWDHGHYINFGPENTSIYTVESFTRDSVIMHRTDKGHFPLTATLTGRISEDGNRIVNGQIVWTSGNSGSGTFTAEWGQAILTSKQNALLADQRRMLDIPCNASANVSIAQAEERAEQLMEAGDLANATCWLRISASQGDADAQGALASILYRGVGVPVNIHEAALWADKAASQSDFLGEHVLSNMYAKGDGKPKDSTKAEYWRAKYEKDKLASERAQQQAQQQRAQAQAQQNAAAGFLILRLLVGAFSADSESHSSSGSGPNRYGEYQSGCAAGYSSACARIGGTPPPE